MRLERRGRKHHNGVQNDPPDIGRDTGPVEENHQDRNRGEGGCQRRRHNDAAPGASNREAVERGGEQSDGAGEKAESGANDHSDGSPERSEREARNEDAVEESQCCTERRPSEENAHRRKAEASTAGFAHVLGHPSNLRGRIGASQGYLKNEREDSDQVVLPHGRGYRHK